LPSTRAIPDRDVFYVAFPKSSIRPLGFPHLRRAPRAAPFFLLTFSFSLLTSPIVPGNKKAAEAFLRAAAFG
jgi:hypothetical protein